MAHDERRLHKGLLPPGMAWLLHHLLARLIFDALVRSIIRERYHINPMHVTLQIDRSSAVLFVWDVSRSFIAEDEALREWAMTFIAGEMLGVDADAVDVLYLDGAVGEHNPCLYVIGDGILISCSEPTSKGMYL